MESMSMLSQVISHLRLRILWELYDVDSRPSSVTHSSSPSSSYRNVERQAILTLGRLIELGSVSNNDDHCSFVKEVKSDTVKTSEAMCPPSKKSRRESKNHEIDMEEDIWREFPEDLFEVVSARLPIASFFRFRAVCRKWNSLLSSHSFSQECAQVEQPHPWFYTITHEDTNTGAMYNPLLKKWHHPSMPSFPAKEIILPVTSAGGLVCFLDIGNRNFFVCNPLTQAFRTLPSRSVHDWSRIAVGMTLSAKGNAYEIMWLEANGDYEVYSSVCNSWTRPGSLPSHIKLPLDLNFRSQAVAIDQVLYFMRANPDGLVSYNMESHVWRQFSIPLPPHSTDHILAECRGRIILIGLLTKNAATCVCIWELQKMTLLWKEVDRMPNMMCLEFYGRQIAMSLHILQTTKAASLQSVGHFMSLQQPSAFPSLTPSPEQHSSSHISGSSGCHNHLQVLCYSEETGGMHTNRVVVDAQKWVGGKCIDALLLLGFSRNQINKTIESLKKENQSAEEKGNNSIEHVV
ncbi:F-box only protein 6 [Nymphaea thermarum]|nr:F-box only protein 6 [Nymphaea thermarum]